MKKFVLLVIMMGLAGFQTLYAQQTVSGVVKNAESGEPIPGATVKVKNLTGAGTVTSQDGSYKLKVPEGGSTLEFSFTGLQTKNVPIEGRSTINVTLSKSDIGLDEVVVTALGISRQKKSLGYSVQDVSGDELTQTTEENVVNTLSGKIAGVQVVNSSGQIGASSTIKIRGNKSFNQSSQPLFVVDGTPIKNSTSSARSFVATDFGNAAMDIDPSNIKDISVLKGASAAALYGSRASNGVILITTKKGEGQQGVGVNVSSSITFSDVYLLPNYQNDYGQGTQGSEYRYEVYNSRLDELGLETLSYQEYAQTKSFNFALDGSGVNPNWDESWGPRLDAGLKLDQIHGEDKPWVSNPDNIRNFFEKGVSYSNNVTLSGGNEKARGRLTLSHVEQKGTFPNTDQTKINLSFNGHAQLNERLSVDANINYVDLSNDNLPQQENSMRNPFIEFNSWFGRQIDLGYLEDHYDELVEYDGKMWAMNWCYWEGQHNNPYWLVYKNEMKRQRKRMFGNVSVNYKIADGITLQGRVGTDYINEHRKYLYHQYTRSWNNYFENASNGTFWGQYRMESETNADLILTIDKNLGERITINSTIGGNYRYVNDQYSTTGANNLVIPDFFSTTNIEGEPSISNTLYEKKTNSVFASLNTGFDSYLFLDLSLRGDWSSTLPSDNWNYWYPSASLGFIFTDAFNIDESAILNYGKLRAGYALVGNDTRPYQLRPNFSSAGNTFNGVNLFRLSTQLPSPTLEPEQTQSIEAGVELKFFSNRLGLDATYYKANTYNQLMSVPIAYSSGYNSWMKNAGEMENRGIELHVYANPVQSKSGFNWDIDINWSKNQNEVVALEDDIESLQIASLYSLYDYTLMAFPGKPWGSIYGTTFERNENGEKLVNDNGMPLTTDSSVVLGNVNPDWLGGITNTFTYKNYSLSFLVDMRMGGDVFSLTKSVGQNTGILQNTVEGNIREEGMVVDGVYEEGSTNEAGDDISGQENETRISAQGYWGASRDWGELAVIDGSYVKLREVNFTYRLPAALISKINMQQVSVSLFGRNLALLYTHESNDVNIDPEVSAGGTVTGTGLESYQVPPARSYGVKLNIKF